MLAPAADASCAAATVSVRPSTARAGDLVTVTGTGWRVGCNDTGQGVREPADKPRLRIEQAGRTFDLGAVAADGRYRFVRRVRLPATLLPVDAAVVGQGRAGQARTTVRIAAPVR